MQGAHVQTTAGSEADEDLPGQVISETAQKLK